MIFDLGQELAGIDLEHANRPIRARCRDFLAIGAEGNGEDDILGLCELAHGLTTTAGLGDPEPGNPIDAGITAGRGQPLAVGAVGNIVYPLRQAGQPPVQQRRRLSSKM